MGPHTATVELLVDKGGFEPHEALAIAEGIDMAIVQSQLVTVPIFDARLADVNQRFADLKAEMRVESARLEGRLNERFFSLKADLEAKIERTRADLVKWVFLVMLGTWPSAPVLLRFSTRSSMRTELDRIEGESQSFTGIARSLLMMSRRSRGIF